MLQNSLFMEYTSRQIMTYQLLLTGYLAYLISKDIMQFFIMLILATGFYGWSMYYFYKYRKIKMAQMKK